MLSFVVRRLATSIIVILLASMLVFVGTNVLPGNAATAILGRNATPQSLAVLTRQLHLNEPVVDRYERWLGGIIQGKLGMSTTSGEPVGVLIGGRLAKSLLLMAVTIALLIPLSCLLGTMAAVRRSGVIDVGISNVTLVVIALPEFVVGTLLVVVFAVSWPVFPALSLFGGGIVSDAEALVLPVVTLLAASLAQTTRMVRANVIDALDSEYVRMARLKGVTERRVIVRHALRNALIPSIQVFGLTIGWLMGGAVVVETVFQYPGLGQGLVNAVSARDLPVVEAIGVIIAAAYVCINLIADLLTYALSPKLRTEL